jgi:hypothetical protein
MLHFKGIMGLFLLAGLLLILLVVGLLVPAWLLYQGWNVLLAPAMVWPALAYGQAVLLWMIVLVLLALALQPFVHIDMLMGDEDTASELEALLALQRSGHLTHDEVEAKLEQIKTSKLTPKDLPKPSTPPVAPTPKAQHADPTPKDDPHHPAYGAHWHQWRERHHPTKKP